MYYITSLDAHGKILQVVNSQKESVLENGKHPEGVHFVFQEPPDFNSYWDSAIENWVSIPEQPSENHEFDYRIKEWFDPRGLLEIKEAKISSLKGGRNKAEFAGFTWDGSVFDSDAISQSRIQGAVQLAMTLQAAGEAFSIDWTLADNTVRTLNFNDMIAVGLALGQHIQYCHGKYNQLKAQVNQCETKEQLKAIVW